MRNIFVIGAVLALLLPADLAGQDGRSRSRRGGSSSANRGSEQDPPVTFRGALKSLTSKEIVIELEEGQAMVIRRSRKTKLMKNDKEIKDSEIAEGAALSVDVTMDAERKPLALQVIVNSPPSKAAPK